MAIRTLLFDLGNVLVYFSHERMAAQIAGACACPERRAQQILFDGGLQRQFERGELSEEAFHQAIEGELGRSVNFDALRRAAADIFELNEPLVPLLDQWKRDGLRLVLLSNTCVTHFDWVRRRFNVLDCFDDFVLSYRVGAVKPEGAIFRSAIATIGCAPAECFYCDDIASYVEQGRLFGLEAEVFTDVPALVGHLELRGVACAATR